MICAGKRFFHKKGNRKTSRDPESKLYFELDIHI
jgi:hypothetical protein